ncbi:MAG: acyl--CoA ligase [Halanaerobiales bacterium]|nr:acyl--CoA ligase [Halanaerobiales bacterium]
MLKSLKRLEDLLTDAAKNVPEKVGLSVSKNEMTYREWFQSCETFSIYLNSLGIKNGKIVGIYLYNSFEYVITYFSILKTGSIVAPFSPRIKNHELLNELMNMGISYLIIDKVTSKLIDKDEFSKNGIDIIYFDLYGNFDYFKQNSNPTSIMLGEEVACLMSSSGTSSGKPKRVVLSHKGIIANVLGHIKHTELEYGNEIFLNCLPLYFSYSQNTQLIANIMLCGRLHIMPELIFSNRIIDEIKRFQPTQFNATPTLMRQICNYKDSSVTLPGLKKIFFGGERADQKLKKTIYEKFPGVEIIHTYGLSEAGPRVSSLRGKDYLRKIDSVGSLLSDVKVLIINEKDEILKNGEIGEVLINSPSLMLGYYNMPELTHKTMNEGWLKSGDLGYMDDEGFLYIVGRKKNIIISGGQNIYPEEIEQCLLSHQGIEQTLVVPELTEDSGEIVKALIVLKDHSLTETDIKKYCLKELSDYKVPKKIEIVEDFKQNFNGKIQRFLYTEGIL